LNGTAKWVSIILLLSAQIVGIIWWAASASADLRELIAKVARMEIVVEQNRDLIANLAAEDREIQRRLNEKP